MRGFKDQGAASRFCREHGGLRDLLCPRRRHNQIISASLRQSRFIQGDQNRAQHHAERINRHVLDAEDRMPARELTDPAIHPLFMPAGSYITGGSLPGGQVNGKTTKNFTVENPGDR